MNDYKKDILKACAFILFLSIFCLGANLMLSNLLFDVVERVDDNTRYLEKIKIYEEKLINENNEKARRLHEYYESKREKKN